MIEKKCPPFPLAIVIAAISVLLWCARSVSSQENIQLQVPPSLVECYNTSYYMNRDNRLPATIETLIGLIEKIENFNNNQDMRQLTASLLYRFRQDGIQRAPGVQASPGVLPYSPSGYQFSKFRILLSRLISGNAFNFPNNSLSQVERCSMHFMLSSSLDMRSRGDESQVCNKISQYRAQRLPRAVNDGEQSNFLGDVEILEILNSKVKHRGAPAGGKIRSNAKSFDFDYTWSDTDIYGGGNNNGDNSISACPVENGVIWTPWGTVAAGNLIAGIAAGLQPQQVQLRTLLALARRSGSVGQQMATVMVDNRWAATLAGDLAEVALVQVPISTQETASVGAGGVWNSTVMPKWYFLTQRNNLEMTDAEIRGGLDGLILGKNIAEWRRSAPSLKLSQLLRMYYSLEGVLNSGIRACDRKSQFTNVAPINEMIAQTSAFAQVLDREMQLRVTLRSDAIAQFAAVAANALSIYVPQDLNDISCQASSALPQDNTQHITPMTDIYLFLDTSWQYYDIVDFVNYILQHLNINPYASRVTMLAANDGSVIVNTTNSLSDVYQNWNYTTHRTFTPGFNLPMILKTSLNLTRSLMNEEQKNSSVGGRSLIALLMPNSATVNEGDSNYAQSRLWYINEQIPDLRFIYYGGGMITRFQSFVRSGADLYTLRIGSNVAAQSGLVVARIKQIPRRIINPRCSSTWSTLSWGTDSMNQYLRPGAINYYRMMPNYFFGEGNGRYVRIQAQNSGSFTVCSSRSTELPTPNSTNIDSSNQNCIQLRGNNYDYDLSKACNNYYTIHECPPLYLSVHAPSFGISADGGASVSSNNGIYCSDAACQTPDQSRYVVSVVNLGCYSGVSQVIASFSFIALAFILRHIVQ